MPYQDLSPDKARQYILTQTCLFDKKAQLSVYEYTHEDGDGHVNHLYRVWDETGKTVMIKQAKPYFSIFGEDGARIPVNRNAIEVAALQIHSAITPEYLPKLLHVDRGNHLFVQEFCPQSLMRVQLSEGVHFPDFPFIVGEYIAKNAFYTSELFLDQVAHKQLQAQFINSEMRRVLEDLLFEPESYFGNEEHSRLQQEGVYGSIVGMLCHDKVLRLELLALRDIYMKKAECLVHGDLHTSNILIDRNTVKIFDLEYSHVGAFSGDLGYLAGNLIYPYVAWFYREGKTADERAEYRQLMLEHIKQTTLTFLRVFAECWQRDAKAMYQACPEYFGELFADLIPQMCGFMGAQILIRTKRPSGQLLDFKYIEGEANCNKARVHGALIALALIKQRRKMRSIDDVLNLIEQVSVIFQQTLQKKTL